MDNFKEAKPSFICFQEFDKFHVYTFAYVVICNRCFMNCDTKKITNILLQFHKHSKKKLYKHCVLLNRVVVMH